MNLFCSSCSSFFPSGAICPHCGQRRPNIVIPATPCQPLWQAQVPGRVARRITLSQRADKRVLIVPWTDESNARMTGCSDGGVTLISTEDGQILWTTRVGLPVEGGAVCGSIETGEKFVSTLEKEDSNELILVACGEGGVAGGVGAVVALNLQSGEELWRARLQGAARGAPLMVQNRVYVAADDGALYCLDIRNGNAVWKEPLRLFDRPVQVPAQPALVQHSTISHTLVVATYGAGFGRIDGKLLAIRERQILWERNVPGNVHDTPLIVGDQVFVVSYKSNPNQGMMHAFYLRNGDPIWEKPFVVDGQAGKSRSQYFSAAPLYHEGILYAGNMNHFLYALDARTGECVWHVEGAEHGIATTPMWAEGLLIYGANDGKVHALEAEGLTHLPSVEMGAPVITNTLQEGDVFYVGTLQGVVAALPWHLGHYEWAAKRLVASQCLSSAGDFFALAGYFEAEAQQRQQYQIQAIQCWGKSGEFEKTAQFLLSQGEETKAAEAFYNAGMIWQHRQPMKASLYFARAAELAYKNRQIDLLNRCNRQWAQSEGLAYVRLAVSNLGTLIAWEAGEVTLRLFQEGKVGLSSGIKLYLGGNLKSRLEAEIHAPFEPGQVWNVPLTITPSAENGMLEIELEYHVSSATAEVMRDIWCVPLKVAVKPFQIGDVGKMDLHVVLPQTTEEGITISARDVGLLKSNGINEEVHIRGSVGAVKKKGKSKKLQVDGDVGLYQEED